MIFLHTNYKKPKLVYIEAAISIAYIVWRWTDSLSKNHLPQVFCRRPTFLIFGQAEIKAGKKIRCKILVKA